jgi:hypothetical protein
MTRNALAAPTPKEAGVLSLTDVGQMTVVGGPPTPVRQLSLVGASGGSERIGQPQAGES